jgi:hypothetical protein
MQDFVFDLQDFVFGPQDFVSAARFRSRPARFRSRPARFRFQLASFRFRLSVVLIIGHLSTLGVVWCSVERPELVVRDDDELTEFAELDIFSSDLFGLTHRRRILGRSNNPYLRHSTSSHLFLVPLHALYVLIVNCMYIIHDIIVEHSSFGWNRCYSGLKNRDLDPGILYIFTLATLLGSQAFSMILYKGYSIHTIQHLLQGFLTDY